MFIYTICVVEQCRYSFFEYLICFLRMRGVMVVFCLCFLKRLYTLLKNSISRVRYSKAGSLRIIHYVTCYSVLIWLSSCFRGEYKEKVKLVLEQIMKAKRGNECTALRFL
jgi:hypothetical protein